MPRLIKRYANRKLYDVEASSYVALEEIARLIREGETVQIVDNVTGEDITAQTLTQVILDEGKRGESLLPTELLHDLLRRGGRVIDSSLGQFRSGVDGLVHSSIGRLTRVLHGPEAEELQRLREQLQQLERTLAQVLRERQGEGEEEREGEGPPR